MRCIGIWPEPGVGDRARAREGTGLDFLEDLPPAGRVEEVPPHIVMARDLVGVGPEGPPVTGEAFARFEQVADEFV
jgi:hypothetical protein